MRVVRGDAAEIRMNEAMAALVEGVDLVSARDLGWLADLRETEWAGDLWYLLTGGWIRHSSGALVLAHGRVVDDVKPVDLTGREDLANRSYLPRSGLDLSADDAMTVLAVRGDSLVWDLLARIDKGLNPGVVTGFVGVHRRPDGAPDGSLGIHEHHDGEHGLWALDDLEGYREEAVLAVTVTPDFTASPAILPPRESLYPDEPAECASSHEEETVQHKERESS
ncbi:hypothetical protein [Amycolatopsis sp. NPDC004079]|uniref:hypothetical protein n=1 Tax=Amycolatopsis sp. NPDC004079 TaxID=3154549 RepID=UPI0033BA14EC